MDPRHLVVADPERDLWCVMPREDVAAGLTVLPKLDGELPIFVDTYGRRIIAATRRGIWELQIPEAENASGRPRG